MAALIQWLSSLAKKIFNCCLHLLDRTPIDDDDITSSVVDPRLWDRPLENVSFGQFSFAIVRSLATIEDVGHVEAGPNGLFAGVYDGHGGTRVSTHCYETLFPHFTRIAQETGRISDQTLKDAIAATEQGFVDVVRREVRQNPNITAVGSCCLVALVWNGTLYVASLGDSRAVIGRLDDVSNRIVAEQLTKDDNLRDQSIREALIREHSEEQDLVVEVNGAYRLKGKLQLSKAIGDAYLKFPEYYRTPGNPRYHLREPVRRAVLSADPTVVTRVLQPHHRFLICASDGLWDHISSERAVEIVHKHPQEGIARRLLKAAIKMACRKSKERYTYDQIKAFGSNQSRRDIHDDITIVVIYFDHDRGYDANVSGLSIRGFRNSHLPPRFNLQGVE